MAMNRRADIDWLRVIAVLLLIPFHTARLFDIWETNYVKNAELSPALSYQNSFLWTWHMPLLFLLAGSASWYAIGVRGGAGYVKERFRRLFIPLVFGMAVIVPPQAYIPRFQDGDYREGYLSFLADYIVIRGDLTGYTGLFTPAHLWFILYLFVISLAGLPLLMRLSKKNRVTDWLAEECGRPGAIFSLAVPLGVTGALPDIDGKNPFFYFVLFLYGYVLMSDTRFQDAVDRHKRVALLLGLAAMAVVLTLQAHRVHFPEKSAGDILYHLLRTFNTWFWLIALLGYGRTCLNFSNAFLRYASRAAYPFYILHQTVIVVIGHYVVQWQANLWAKYIVIAVSALLVTVLLYDLCVKRTRATRFLFGMHV